jgi:hypothetical protein
MVRKEEHGGSKIERRRKLTITLVLLIKLQMAAPFSNPVNSVPVCESGDQGSRIFGERMEGQPINTASAKLRI